MHFKYTEEVEEYVEGEEDFDDKGKVGGVGDVVGLINMGKGLGWYRGGRGGGGG